MAIVRVVATAQHLGVNGGTTSAIDTSGANLLTAGVTWGVSFGTTPPALSDSKGNTWVARNTSVVTDGFAALYDAKNATVGTGHTFTCTGTSGFISVGVQAFSGVDTSAPFVTQNHAGADGTLTSQATGAVVPTTDGSLIVTVLCNYIGATTNRTIDNSFNTSAGDQIASDGTTYYAYAQAYLVQSPAASVNPTWSWTPSQAHANAVIVAYQPPVPPPTPVGYSVSYNGDYATWTAAQTAINAQNFTVTGGGLTGIGSILSTIVVSVADGAKNLVGHPVTVGANTRLIVSQTGSVCTIGALAGYPATWPLAPGTGVAYTIAAVVVTLTQGLAAAGNAVWNEAMSFSGTTTSATCTLTIANANPWGASSRLAANTGNSLVQPAVNIASGHSFATANLFLVGLQFANATVSTTTVAFSAGSPTCTGCLFSGAPDNSFHPVVSMSGGGTITALQSVFYSTTGAARSDLYTLVTSTANGVLVGCTIYGGAYGVSNNGGGTNLLTGCAIYGQNNGYTDAGATFTTCAGDRSGTSGVTQIGTGATEFNSVSAGSIDFRPLVGAGIINNTAGQPSPFTNNVRDIFNNLRGQGSHATATFGAAENSFTAPSVQPVTWTVAYNGDITSLDPVFVATGAYASGQVNVTAVASGTAMPGDLMRTNNSTPNIVELQVNTLGTASGGTTGTYNVAQWSANFAPTAAFSTSIYIDRLQRIAGTNQTYYQANVVCPATAPDTGHIYLVGATTDCIGHVVGHGADLAIIGSFDPSSVPPGLSTLATAPIGSAYVSVFSAKPLINDPYTIYPVNVQFNIALTDVSSHRRWNTATQADNTFVYGGAVFISSICAAGQQVTIQGAFPQLKTVAGTMDATLTSGAAIISAGGHYQTTIVSQTQGAQLIVRDMNLFTRNDSGFEAGCARTDQEWGGPGQILLERCIMRGDGYTIGADHNPGIFFGGSQASAPNCAVILTASAGCVQISDPTPFINSMLVFTGNILGVVAAATAPINTAGQNVIKLTSVAGVAATVNTYVGAKAGVFPGAVPTISSVNGGASTITLSGNLSAALNPGDFVWIGMQFACGDAGVTLTNVITLGCVNPSTNTFVTSATDLPGVSGTTQINYATAYPNLFGVGSSGVLIQPATGVNLPRTAINAATNGVDIFGNARTVGSSAIGPIETTAVGRPFIVSNGGFV